MGSETVLVYGRGLVTFVAYALDKRAARKIAATDYSVNRGPKCAAMRAGPKRSSKIAFTMASSPSMS